MTRTSNFHPWTEEDVALLVELRKDEGLEWPEIAEQIPGTTANTCASKYHVITASRRAGVRHRGTQSAKCPNSVLLERDKRELEILARNQRATECGNLNHLAFSDPAPGRSALDQKLRGA